MEDQKRFLKKINRRSNIDFSESTSSAVLERLREETNKDFNSVLDKEIGRIALDLGIKIGAVEVLSIRNALVKIEKDLKSKIHYNCDITNLSKLKSKAVVLGYVKPNSLEDLQFLVKGCNKLFVPYYIVGGGRIVYFWMVRAF